MTTAAVTSTPPLGAVLAAQVRAVGYALRGPALVVLPLAGLAALLSSLEFMRSSQGEWIHFHPERQELLFGLLGLVFPIATWMEEERLGSGFIWTLPVDRRCHAVAKVLAGWVWLIAAVAALVFWLLALTLLSGGSLVAEESLRLVPLMPAPAGALLDASAIQTVTWIPKPILWLVPFTAATGMYLLASALVLGTRYPLRWMVGTTLALYLFVGVSSGANAEWLPPAPGRLLTGLFDGPYGLDTLLTARTGSLKTEAILSTGERVVVWRGLPDLGQWAAATLLWTGAGLVALGVAASRHRERR